MATITGGCACGAVRYEIDAAPLLVGHCQCGKCQKLSGGGHNSFAAFPESAVKITGAITYWGYTADSGHKSSRGFCPTCGSPVTGKPEGAPGVFAVTLGSLDDGAAVHPQMVFFAAKGQPWDHLADGLTVFPGMPPMPG